VGVKCSLTVVSWERFGWLAGAPGRIRTRDPLLRRLFHAGGQPALAQIGSCSRCPRVTVGDRSFPPVLAWKWHVALSRCVVCGLVDPVECLPSGKLLQVDTGLKDEIMSCFIRIFYRLLEFVTYFNVPGFNAALSHLPYFKIATQCCSKCSKRLI
jgi:hypothetical protein